MQEALRPGGGAASPAWGVCPCSGDGPGLAAPDPEGPGLPARYSSARIGPMPPAPGIAARVAHLPDRACGGPGQLSFRHPGAVSRVPWDPCPAVRPGDRPPMLARTGAALQVRLLQQAFV